METQEKRWRTGDKALKFTTTAKDKFDKSTRWLWGKIKTPGFPQPFYIEGSPHFIEREVDEFLARCAGEKAAA
jgi:predicted DNA-binding transcriptional regulator AlpA